MGIQSFDAFIAPLAPDQFLGEVFSVKPLHIRGERGRFAYLLPWDALNEILYSHRLDYPRLRLAKEGEIIPKEKYMKPSAPGGRLQLDAQVATELFQQGAMLVLDGVEEMHEPIRALCQMLERTLCEYVSTNVYAGWHATQGFNTHWDEHEVIIVQVGGIKHWRVFEPKRKHPVSQDRTLELKAPQDAPYWEGDLRSGDLLHIPRGWWHDAVPVGQERTLHITLTISRRNGLDLAEKLLARLREHETLRADLPRFASAEKRKGYLHEFRAAVQLSLQSLDLDAYLREVDSFAPAALRPSLPWTATPEGEAIPPTAWLRWRPPRRMELQVQGDKVTFEALGATFTFEQFAAPVIQDLQENVRTRFDALCAAHDDVEPTAIERFVVQLVSKGLVMIAV